MISLSLPHKSIYFKEKKIDSYTFKELCDKKELKYAFREKVYFYEKNDTIFRNQAVAYLKPKYKAKKRKIRLTKRKKRRLRKIKRRKRKRILKFRCLKWALQVLIIKKM